MPCKTKLSVVQIMPGIMNNKQRSRQVIPMYKIHSLKKSGFVKQSHCIIISLLCVLFSAAAIADQQLDALVKKVTPEII